MRHVYVFTHAEFDIQVYSDLAKGLIDNCDDKDHNDDIQYMIKKCTEEGYKIDRLELKL